MTVSVRYTRNTMATVLDRVGTLLGRKAETRAELSAKK